jgi:hypothetical protein
VEIGNMTTQTMVATGDSTGESELVSLIRYPSVASYSLCRALGIVFDSIPRPRINGIKLSHLLFTLPLSPVPAIAYFILKFTGDRYVLTDRSLQRRKAIGDRLVARVSLADIAQIEVRQSRGQAFYKAADLYLLDKDGDELMRLEGVVRAEVFRQSILKARRALVEIDSSLATIRARQRS